MFSKARRSSKSSAKSKRPEPPRAKFSFEDSLDSPLPTPTFPTAVRPSSSDGIPASKKNRAAPTLPPAKRVTDTNLSSKPPSLPPLDFRKDADNVSISSRKSAIRQQRSYEHISRPKSSGSTRSNMQLRDSGIAPQQTTYITMDPMFPRSLPNSPLSPTFASSIQARNGNIESRKSLKPVDTTMKTAAKRSTLAPSPNTSSAQSRSTTPNSSQEKEASSSVSTTNHLGINFDSPAMEASMFPTYKAQTPVEDTPAMSRSFIDSRDRPYSQAKPRNENLSPISPHSGKHISPTQASSAPFSPVQPTSAPFSPVQALSAPFSANTDSPASANIYFNSPFSIESFKLPASAPTTAINSPIEQKSKSTIPTSSQPPTSTIGTPFESTSAAHPPPQLVATRPKTEGVMSTVAGVQVPTHHSTGVRRDSISAASKSDKRRTKLLNPMALLSRRKSPGDQPAVEEKKPPKEAPRQKASSFVGVEQLPEDFDPRIKGKIVHDFSAPRQPRRDFSSPTTSQPHDSMLQNGDSIDNRSSTQQSTKHASTTTASSTQRRSTHTPIFHEQFTVEKEPVPSNRVSGGVGAENRENKDFLARFSQQSSNSTFSQESAILPPFARRSQILDPAQAGHWRDEEGSWSSGRDSGGNASSTNAPGDRESGLSAFSAISPATGRSSDSMMPTALFADATNAISTNNLGPLAVTTDVKEERLSNKIESFSRPGNWRQSPTLSSPDQTTTFRKSSPIIQDAPQFHAITTPEKVESPLLPAGAPPTSPAQRALSTQTSPVSPKSAQKTERAANGHRKSNASRFSFQLGSDGTEEEKALENKFRESGVLPTSDRQGDDEDDDDYFDEDAMDDMDEMEIQSQMKAAVEPVEHPKSQESNALDVEKDAKKNESMKDNSNHQPSEKKQRQSYYEKEIPYVANERELTYAEHPVFRAHSALADSRRNSYQSTLFDSYLASSPHRTSESRDRQASVTSLSAGTKVPLGSASHSASRSVSGKSPSIPAMSPLHENGEESSQKPTPITPTTDVTSPSAFSDFRFTESPDRSQSEKRPNRERYDDDVIQKPKWARTADMWKQYSPVPPVPQIQEPTMPARSLTSSTQPSRSYTPQDRSFAPQHENTRSITPQERSFVPQHENTRSYTPQSDGANYKGSYHRGVRVRKPTGSKPTSEVTSPTARISSPSKHDDMYYDDGRFDQDKKAETQSKTDEAVVDRMSRTGAEDLSPLSNRLTMASLSSDGPYPSIISPTMEAHRRGSSLLLEDLPLMAPVDPALLPQRNPSEDAKRLGRNSKVPPLPGVETETETGVGKSLQAYHQALADAANRAAAEGRFYRKLSIAESTQSSSTEHDEIRNQNNATAKVPVGMQEPAQASNLAFDFGFDQSSVHESDWADEQDDEDDDIVAAANAEALANDADGFYGSEFGFYAKARPGVDDDATNGGFFGEDGDDGLTRKRSTKEPNLTPITERSEFSTRNSFIGLHNMSSSAISTPALARLPTSAFTDNEISFEQLRKLRQNAFGGSNGSLSSQQRSSPTNQHHGGVVMTNAHSNDSSNSGIQENGDSTHSRKGSGSGPMSFAR